MQNIYDIPSQVEVRNRPQIGQHNLTYIHNFPNVKEITVGTVFSSLYLGICIQSIIDQITQVYTWHKTSERLNIRTGRGDTV